MNIITDLSIAYGPDSAIVRFRPVGADHILAIWQQGATAKCAGVTQYLVDTLGEWSSQALANNGTELTFTGAQWPFVESVAAPAGSSPNGKNLAFNTANGPAACVQANGFTPGVVYDCALFAVDALGPIPYQTQYQDDLKGYSVRISALDSDCQTTEGGCDLGSNMGCALVTDQAGLDFMVVNGQGAPTANPNIVAVAYFQLAVPAAAPPIPSAQGAQPFFETFTAEPSFTEAVNINAEIGAFDQQMTTVDGEVWDIVVRQAALATAAGEALTRAFWHGGHIMDVLFEGGTEGTGNPGHDNFSGLIWTPQRTFTLGVGQVFHVRAAFDAQSTTRRYPSIVVFPADQPLGYAGGGQSASLAYQENSAENPISVNTGNQAVFVGYQMGQPILDVLNGVNKRTTPVGPAGAATFPISPFLNNYQKAPPPDCRAVWDFFTDGSRFALYQDGVKIFDETMAGVASFLVGQPLRFGIDSWSYHTVLDMNYLPALANYPHSIEHHIDDVGAEVLSGWSALPVVAPAYAPIAPATSSPFPSALATLLDLATALQPAPPVATVTLPANWSAGLPAGGGVVNQAVVEALIKVLEGLIGQQ